MLAKYIHKSFSCECEQCLFHQCCGSQCLTTSLAPKKKTPQRPFAPLSVSPDQATNTHVSGNTQESYSLLTTNSRALGFHKEKSVCPYLHSVVKVN